VNLRDPADSPIPVVRRVATGEFDEGPDYATYRRRGTTDWLLVQTLDGQGRFGHVAAVPGSVTLVRPGTLHDYATVEGVIAALKIYFRGYNTERLI